MNEQELRCYTFTNFMLSPIQQGIQSGHAAMELINKYIADGDPTYDQEFADQILDWVANHKTIVCLNGGNAAGVRDIKGFFDLGNQGGDNPFPYAGFYEDEQSLDGALTSVAVILPARIFETASLLRRRVQPEGVTFVYDRTLNEHRLTVVENGETRLETFSEWEYELMTRLNSCALAR